MDEHTKMKARVNGDRPAGPQSIAANQDGFGLAAEYAARKNDDWMEPQGLTKREYFAGLAMQGILAGSIGEGVNATVTAKNAVGCADALLAALEEGQ